MTIEKAQTKALLSIMDVLEELEMAAHETPRSAVSKQIPQTPERVAPTESTVGDLRPGPLIRWRPPPRPAHKVETSARSYLTASPPDHPGTDPLGPPR
jgi:hypothetical protein